MNILVNVATVLVGLLLLLVVIRLIVKKRMTESQSVLWIFIGAVIIIVGIFPPLIPLIASWLGIWYPPTILFLIAFVGLLLIVFNTTIVLSEQSSQLHELSMQITLLKEENNSLKKVEQKGEEDN